jgi:hypothetical protein
LSTYLSFTLTTAMVGWFGIISLFLTPFFILTNTTELIASARLVGWRKVLLAIIAALGIPIGVAVVLFNARRH